jgi:carboxymethylenebutenolidase
VGLHRLLVALCLTIAAIMSKEACAQTGRDLHTTGEKPVSYDEFGPQSSANCLVVLHGVSGLSMPFYKDQAAYFGEHDFHVFFPHYFDATHSPAATTDHYRVWEQVVEDLVAQCHQVSSVKKVFLVGYSLGASVALAAGSQGVSVNGIAEWYGSLPDEFFYQMKGMPPLLILHGERDANIPIDNGQQLVKLCDMKQLHCDHHFYPDQGHGFSGKSVEDADQRTLAFFAAN